MTPTAHQIVKPDSKHRETQKHQSAFEAWYEAGCSFRKISQILAVPERTLYDWAKWFDWHDRASRRDAEIRRLTDQATIRECARRVEEHLKSGTLLRTRGTEYLLNNKISTAREALQAIRIGIEIERQADPFPDWVLRVLNADDHELDELERALKE